MTMMEAILLLNNLVDESDPDVSICTVDTAWYCSAQAQGLFGHSQRTLQSNQIADRVLRLCWHRSVVGKLCN